MYFQIFIVFWIVINFTKIGCGTIKLNHIRGTLFSNSHTQLYVNTLNFKWSGFLVSKMFLHMITKMSRFSVKKVAPSSIQHYKAFHKALTTRKIELKKSLNVWKRWKKYWKMLKNPKKIFQNVAEVEKCQESRKKY